MATRRFTVTGTWPFPFDMLRYDACWPATEKDAANIETLTREADPAKPYTLAMETGERRFDAPTVARWRSLAWRAE